MNEQDYQFTVSWWEALLADDERMVRWLQKLQGTEFSGYADNREAATKWANGNVAVHNIFLATGDDEMRHSDLLISVLHGRGAWPPPEETPASAYWAEMDGVIDSLEACAAVFHLGEQLAAERFEVIADHPRTPKDIRRFLSVALPDEQHHARVFKRLTTAKVLATVTAAHESAIYRLKAAREAQT